MYYQEIPIGNVLEASNSFIIDQGVAIFAMVIFSLIIFIMLGIIIMMLRYMTRESRQQDKIINQNGLTLAQMARQSERGDRLEKLMADLINVQTVADTDKKKFIDDSLTSLDANTASIVKQTESVDTMKDELVKLTDVTEAVRVAIENITKDGVVLSTEAHQSIVNSVVSSLADKITDIKTCVEEAIKSTQEAPKVAPAKTIENKPQGKE